MTFLGALAIFFIGTVFGAGGIIAIALHFAKQKD